MLIEKVPNQTTGGGAIAAQCVEFGFQRSWNLNHDALHLHKYLHAVIVNDSMLARDSSIVKLD